MPSPFPGMDPFLEHTGLWPDVHNRLIAALGSELGPVLRPAYVVRLEERTYLSQPDGLVFVGRPDLAIHARAAAPSRAEGGAAAATSAAVLAVEVPVPDRIRETYLEVRSVEGEVVTVLEVISPSNKVAGEGRRLYEAKRMTVFGTRTSLVEIDLVRAGDPLPVFGAASSSDYRILVSRGDRRPRASLHMFSVRDPIPRFRLPLRPGDDEPELDVGTILGDVYDRAAFDLSIDYRQEPVPPLSAQDREWADALLRSCRQR